MLPTSIPVSYTHLSAVDGGFRFLSLYPTDIDGSGVIEIPAPIPFPPLDEESETCLLYTSRCV